MLKWKIAALMVLGAFSSAAMADQAEPVPTPPPGAGTGANAAAPVPAPHSFSPPASLSDIGYFTGEQLKKRCALSEVASSSYCFAYITAVTDTVRAYEIWLGAKEFCLPARTAQADIRRAFLVYVDNYPQQASGQAASVIVNALKQTYPCD